MARLLIIEDEPGVARALERFAEGEGHTCTVAATGEAGLEAVAEGPDLVLCDVRLPGLDGLEVLRTVKERAPDLPVIVMTAHGTVDTAVQAIKQGAYEYLLKPLDLDKLRVGVSRALEKRRLSREVAALRRELAATPGQASMVGTGPSMQEVFKRIGAVAASDVSVLLTGETGTGKEVVARAIHAASDRCEGPFVPVNCGAVPEALLESELYGHEKGAFTGAESLKRGRIETAAGGTLFLDEIGDLPPAAQVKLLRFLEDHVIERVGSTERIEVDVRLVAATHVDLNERLREGTFREDLYYRLNVVNVALPPLRDRLEDVPLLVAHFLEAAGAGATALSEDALAVLHLYSWPGNVRELRNAVDHAVVLARGRLIGPEHWPPDVLHGGPDRSPAEAIRRLVSAEMERLRAEGGEELYERLLDLVEEPLIKRALALTANNQVKASEMLGIHRTTLRKKMERYGLLKVKPRGEKSGDGVTGSPGTDGA